jgi:hypothetical protein
MLQLPTHPLKILITLSVCLSRSWNPDLVCPSVEVLKPRSVRLSIEVLKRRSHLSICRGLETHIPNCKSKITAQKPAWLLFSGFSWNPTVLWGFFEITRTGSGFLILNFFQIPETCDSLTPSFNSFNSHFTNTQTWRLFNISNTRPTLLI